MCHSNPCANNLPQPLYPEVLVMVFRVRAMQVYLYSIYCLLPASGLLLRQSTLKEAVTSCDSIHGHTNGFPSTDTLKELTLFVLIPFNVLGWWVSSSGESRLATIIFALFLLIVCFVMKCKEKLDL